MNAPGQDEQMLPLHIWDRNPTTELCENFPGSTSHSHGIAPALRPERNSAVPWSNPAACTQNQAFQFPNFLNAEIISIYLMAVSNTAVKYSPGHCSVSPALSPCSPSGFYTLNLRKGGQAPSPADGVSRKNGLRGATCMLCLWSLLPSPCPRAFGCL